jgi:hypothetical protein
VKLLAKILLCIAVSLLFTHQLIPHDHDEHTDITVHHPFENSHDHFASHNVDHVFYNNSFEQVALKVFIHYIDCIQPSVSEAAYFIKYLTCKRKYRNIRPPLISYSSYFSFRAPPVSFSCKQSNAKNTLKMH